MLHVSHQAVLFREFAGGALPCLTAQEGVSGDSVVKNLPATAGNTGLVSGSRKSLEEEMTTHSNMLAWEIP